MRKIRIEDFQDSHYSPADVLRWELCYVALLAVLDHVTDEIGKKATVTSTFRTRQENIDAGGAEASRHLTGEAWDVLFPGVHPGRVIAAFRKHPSVGGLGVDFPSGAVHFDLRSIDRLATWGQVTTQTPDGQVKDHNYAMTAVLDMFGPELVEPPYTPGEKPGVVLANVVPDNAGKITIAAVIVAIAALLWFS